MPFKLSKTVIATTILAALEAGAFLSIHSIQQFQQYDYLATTPLKPKKAVVQTLPIQHNNMTALILYIGPLSAQAAGKMEINLQSNKESIYSITTDAAAFTATPFLPLDFPTQTDSANKKYTLTVSFADGLNPAIATPDGTPIPFFALPQYEVTTWNKLQVLAQRINIIHGGIVPPGVVYVLLAAALWMSNLFFVTALVAIWKNFKPSTRSS